LGLDPSQYAALRLALTHELALIQGPPGTGKSLLGLRIVELLLDSENRRLWRGGDGMKKAPLLLLSYTNHALDQFLSALLELPVLHPMENEDVVRVGSRSENKFLEKINIAALRKFLPKWRLKDYPRNERFKMRKLQLSRSKLDTEIGFYTQGIVLHTHFKSSGAIQESTYASLLRKDERRVPLIVTWLYLDRPDLGMNTDNDAKLLKDSRGQQSNPSGKTAPAVQRQGCHIKMQLNTQKGSQHAAEENGELVEEHEGRDKEMEQIEEEIDMEEERERMLDLDSDTSDSDEEEIEKESDQRVEHCNLQVSASHMAVFRTTDEHGLTWHFPPALLNQKNDFFQSLVSKIQQEVSSENVMSEEEEGQVDDVWQLGVADRWRLYRLWLRRLLKPLRETRQTQEDKYRAVSCRVRERRAMIDLDIMRNARVVAMTTTGAARCSNMLRELGVRVIIVEEAAQVSSTARPLHICFFSCMPI
jgi:hypothetical protein